MSETKETPSLQSLINDLCNAHYKAGTEGDPVAEGTVTVDHEDAEDALKQYVRNLQSQVATLTASLSRAEEELGTLRPPAPAEDATPTLKTRSCNRHDDCEAADTAARAKGRRVDHCHDEGCSECFGY